MTEHIVYECDRCGERIELKVEEAGSIPGIPHEWVRLDIDEGMEIHDLCPRCVDGFKSFMGSKDENHND